MSFLIITDPEDIQPDKIHSNDESGANRSKSHGVESEVSSLETVCEGDESEIAERKHEAEAIGSDVHLIENDDLNG